MSILVQKINVKMDIYQVHNSVQSLSIYLFQMDVQLLGWQMG